MEVNLHSCNMVLSLTTHLCHLYSLAIKRVYTQSLEAGQGEFHP